MKLRTPRTLLGFLLFVLSFLLLQGAKINFWNPEEKLDQNQTFSLDTSRKSQLENITGLLVQMPNKNYVSSYLNSLEWSKHIAIQTYELTEKRVKSRIEEKARQGVQFRIMIENQKYQQFQNTFKKLSEQRSGLHSIKLISDEHMPTSYLHSKITLADSGFWIQSSNLTHSTFAKNREHLFRSEHPAILQSLKRLFDKDFSGEELKIEDLHPNLVVCNLNCRAVITDLLSWAQKSITIQTQYLTDPALFNLIAEKSQTLKFQAIFSDTEHNHELPNYFGKGQVRLLKKPYVHTKMILVDDEILLLGSMNLSANSLDKNREIWILILDPDLITQFKKGFELDWQVSE